MLKKCLSLVLAGLLFQTTCAAVAVSARARGGGDDDEDAKLAQKVKASIYELGAGPEAHIKIKPRDKTTLEGYVASITKDSFVVAGAKKRAAYTGVKQVKGNNFSTGAKIGIGAAIAAGIVIVIVLATRGGGRDDSGPIRCGGVTTPCP